MRESKERNKNGAGKGDFPRPVDRKKWDKGWVGYEKKKGRVKS